MLNIQDLKPGDIILSLDSYGRAEHSAMFLARKNGVPYVVHATTGKYNSLIVTKLHPDEKYQIFRCKNKKIARNALKKLNYWSKFHPPYDYQRMDVTDEIAEMPEHSPFKTCGLDNYLEYTMKAYKENLYRIIKFTARAHAPILFSANSKRGFTCNNAVILAYQCAELEMQNLVNLKLSDEFWISDKHSNLESINSKLLSKEFIAYRDKITVKSGSKNCNNFLPSISAWKDDAEKTPEEFFKEFDSVFPIDNKITSSAALQYYMQKTPKHWENVGELSFTIPKFSKSEVELWGKHLLESVNRASKLKTNQDNPEKLASIIKYITHFENLLNAYSDGENASDNELRM